MSDVEPTGPIQADPRRWPETDGQAVGWMAEMLQAVRSGDWYRAEECRLQLIGMGWDLHPLRDNWRKRLREANRRIEQWAEWERKRKKGDAAHEQG